MKVIIVDGQTVIEAIEFASSQPDTAKIPAPDPTQYQDLETGDYAEPAPLFDWSSVPNFITS